MYAFVRKVKLLLILAILCKRYSHDGPIYRPKSIKSARLIMYLRKLDWTCTKLHNNEGPGVAQA